MSFNLDPRIRQVAEVLRPEDAMEPILPPGVRAALYNWMTEIRAQDELRAVNVEPRRSVMLEGPPGCGKTTMANHLAARLGLPLVSVKMDQLRSKWMGHTGEQIGDLFKAIAEQADECVLFMDEFDAVGTKRADGTQGADHERNAVVNSLLQRVEGFDGTLIAATNRAKMIDPALWRRFGLRLTIPIPGDEERWAILALYLQPYDLPEESMDLLCDATAGAAPSLLRDFSEGIKRDLVLSARMNRPTDAAAVLTRVVTAARPHPEYTVPPLWEEKVVLARVSKGLKWPPHRKDDGRKDDKGEAA